jgi:hypothetical protein
MTSAHPKRRQRRRRRVAAGALVAVVGAGVLNVFSGVNSRVAAASPRARAVQAAAKATPTNPLPAMSVTDVRTGKPVALRSALSGRKPLLVWFWAPH